MVLISEEEEVTWKRMVPSCGHRGQLGDWGELQRIGRKRARALCKGPAQVTPPLLGEERFWVLWIHGVC